MALRSDSIDNVTFDDSSVTTYDAELNMSDFTSFIQPFEVPHIRWLYITLFGAIFLCCVLGNITVIYVILRHKKMRNVTNFFLANLAVSDLCVGVFCILPNLSTFLSPYWMLGVVFCKSYYFIQCVSYTASVLILTIISLERYFAIIHPMLNKRMTRLCILRVAVIVIWVCAALYGMPNLIAYDIYRVNSENTTMDFCVTAGNWPINMEVYSIINFIVLYALPLLMIIVMYVRISKTLWSSGKDMGVTPYARYINNDQSQNSKVCTGNGVRCPNSEQPCGKVDAASLLLKANVTSGQSHRNDYRVGNGKSRNLFLQATRPSHLRCDTENISPGRDQPRNMYCHCKNKSEVPTYKKCLPKHISQNRITQKIINPLANRRKVIRLLICIIVVFAVCVLPHHIRLLWQYWYPSNRMSFSKMLVPPTTFLFFYANSALNPFLYALLSDHFRTAFIDLFPACCRRCWKMPGSHGLVSCDTHTHHAISASILHVANVPLPNETLQTTSETNGVTTFTST